MNRLMSLRSPDTYFYIPRKFSGTAGQIEQCRITTIERFAHIVESKLSKRSEQSSNVALSKLFV